MVIRLATRMPVVFPMRITDELADILKNYGPLWLVTQFNHKNELTSRAALSISKLIDRGIPVLNQSVLLKGVNDSVEALQDLFQALVRNRVKPYYLFQGDLASGTSHFRVDLSRGWEIMSELRTRISGLALPAYAVDMPGGGGKIPLTENFFLGKDDNYYYFKNIEGREYTYPRENK
jgi:lysine 2,3-aminomutase